MKRLVTLMVSMILITCSIAGCTKEENDEKKGNAPKKTAVAETPCTRPDVLESSALPGDDRSVKSIKVRCAREEEVEIIQAFQKLHPDFPYEINILHDTSDYDAWFDWGLGDALQQNGLETPDIYFVHENSVNEFVRHQSTNYARFACPYNELGLDIEKLMKEGGMDQYAVDTGTNEDGTLVALPYQGNGGAFIYRRSIAKRVWGTDEPSAIEERLGHTWNSFLQAAEELKAKGYAMVSSIEDIWNVVDDSAESPWVLNGKLVLDPKRDAYLDLAKTLHEQGYVNDSVAWQDQWYGDMSDQGIRKVFGYFGSEWLINYSIAACCGGTKEGEGTFGDWAVCKPVMPYQTRTATYVMVHKNCKVKKAAGELIKWMTLDASKTGLQNLLATGAIHEGADKEQVVLSKVMRNVKGESNLLGKQDYFEVFAELENVGRKSAITSYDEQIESAFIAQVQAYVYGNKSREQALADFKKTIKEDCQIRVE